MILLALLNLVLSVATLSIWRFWGRTRVRRALWGGVVAWDDPAEYTGTGKELFLGFLMALVVIYLPLFALYGYAQTLVVADDPRGMALLVGLYPVTVFLVAAGFFRARRYQLSRTVWRGIRGGQTGSAWIYAFRSMAVWILTPLSLGWAWPWGAMWLARYRMRHTTFGDRHFVCEADAGRLYGRFAVVWLCTLAYLGGVVVLSWGVIEEGMVTGAIDSEAAALIPLLLLVGMVVLVWPWAWYRASFLRVFVAGTGFEGCRFSAAITPWRLVRLVLGNGLISLFSLGLLRPWAALRVFRYGCAVIALDDVPDFAAVHQGRDRGPRTGEGLISVLDGAGEF